MGKIRKADIGNTLGDALLYGLVVVVLAFSGYAVFDYARHIQPTAKEITFKGWYDNKSGYERALAEQRATGKPFLLYMFATWCPHCKEFNANILQNPAIRHFISHYPHVRVEPEHGDAERQLMTDYNAPGYPSFYVVFPDGERRFVETGVATPQPRPKTAGEFLQSLRAVLNKS